MQKDHICAKRAICFQCFKAGIDRARERRTAWAQRSLPFDAAPAPAMTPRALAHRQQMLDHLAKVSRESLAANH